MEDQDRATNWRRKKVEGEKPRGIMNARIKLAQVKCNITLVGPDTQARNTVPIRIPENDKYSAALRPVRKSSLDYT